MTAIKVDDQSCGPRCHPTPIIKIRLDDVVLRDMIAEAMCSDIVRRKLVGEIGACACQSPSHVGRLVGTFHDFFAGKHNPENFNYCLKQGSKSPSDYQFRNMQTRTFSKNEGSNSLKGVRIINVSYNDRNSPIILQRRLGDSYAQNLFVPIATEVLEVYKHKNQTHVPVHGTTASYAMLL